MNEELNIIDYIKETAEIVKTADGIVTIKADVGEVYSQDPCSGLLYASCQGESAAGCIY